MKKATILFLAILVNQVVASAQQTSTLKTNWTIIHQSEKLVISAKLDECRIISEGYAAEHVILRVQNKTNASVKVKWHNDLYYAGKCATCDKDEYGAELTLGAQQAVTGTCDIGASDGLRYFSKWLDLPNSKILTDIKVTSVTTSTLSRDEK